MLIRGSVFALGSIAGLIFAQIPAADEVVKSAVKSSWAAGLVAAIVLAGLSFAGYVIVRLFGKHGGIVTNGVIRVTVRW